ncbi:DUF4364 family protein [Oscillospiraceae bacterium WX1]
MDERLGFIRDKLDIKILILFILRRLPEPVTMETLSDLTLCDEGISYFDFAECVTELVETAHLQTDGHTYTLTEKGVQNGEITENSLPFSVRVKAEHSAADMRFRLNRKSMISTSHAIRRKGGYSVHLSLSDGVSDLVSMELYASTEQQARTLEKGFAQNAESVYNRLIQMLLDSSNDPVQK